jgi:hypothetical protein
VIANRALWDVPARRLLLVKWVICAALLSGMVLSPKLWMSERGFPTVPLVTGTPGLPQWASLAVTGLLVLSVLLVAVMPRPRLALLGALAVGAILVLFDVNRLQPWFYQYLLMFVALMLARWDDPDSLYSRAAWAGCAIILIGIYFWSGVQKANMTFATEVFPWLISPLGERAKALTPLWPVAPVFEAAVGILLLVPRTRTVGIVMACAMHALLLLVLGPLGHNHNSIVWPWNLWMPVLAVTLFWRNGESLLRSAGRLPTVAVIAILVGVMPVLNFLDWWDGYLSASLYSGKLRDAWIYLSEDAAETVSRAYSPDRQALVQTKPGEYRLNVTSWGFASLNVPPYAEPRVYRAIVKDFEAKGVPPVEMSLYIRDRVSPTSAARTFSVSKVE